MFGENFAKRLNVPRSRFGLAVRLEAGRCCVADFYVRELSEIVGVAVAAGRAADCRVNAVTFDVVANANATEI